MPESAQVAMPSSPVLRISLLVTVELVTPPVEVDAVGRGVAECAGR